MTLTETENPLPVVLRFWTRGKGHIRCLIDGRWVHVTRMQEARDLATKHGYDGIRVRAYA